MTKGNSESSMTGIAKERTLLLVDDNAINLKILTKILRDDYNLITADNGQKALDILLAAGVNSISAVVLDIVMPVMDGYEVLRRMRSDNNLMKIPVIVASAQDESHKDNKELLALSLGANDYLTKPYNPEIIKHRIANTIYLRETAAFVNTVQTDSLTGLLSRDYFYLRVDEILKSNPDKKYDMICCDIERFKLVKDLYGVDTGNQLLKGCADIFKSYIGNYGLCGKIGSDVFAFFIVHQERYSTKQFSEANEKINSLHINLKIQLKYGICVIDDHSVSANILCDRAQLAIADIKGKYGVYYKYYDDAIRKKMMDEQYITSHMKQALENNEFEVYFQPKYELKTETIIGAEALVRWNDPQRGMLFPGSFIPFFEKNGFITDLDLYVWEACCKKIRSWLDAGNSATPISVNVSRADIYNPYIDKILLSLLQKYELSPKYIYLEITESAYTENAKQMIDAVFKLKKIGFKIEMDDFGTGYSSLNMLSELPIDVVKLDIGFMQNQEKLSNRSILSFIISLAKWMNLLVIAEGVETADQVNLLRSLGCEYVQGFFYARALPAPQFEELLKKQLEGRSDIRPLNALSDDGADIFHPSAIIIQDKNGKDFEILNSLFSEEYQMLNTVISEETLSIIGQRPFEISVVLCSYDSSVSQEELSMVAIGCRQQEIPAIAIISSMDDIGTVMDAGFSDYLVKPYHHAAVKNRIQSIIGNSQMSQMQVEKEINLAILEMKKRAEQDSLTGLLNRAEFENKIQEFFRDNNSPNGYFIMLDIDNFKQVNDNCGHIAGDSTLQAVAGSLHYLFPETEIIGRMGGDEFALFIPYKEKIKQLKIKVEKLCNALEYQGEALSMSCSVGISSSPENGMDFQSLYETADIALLYAKRNGKSQYRFYESGMQPLVDEQFEQRAAVLLDNASDAMFVCDAITSEVIYINDTACSLIGKTKKSCLGSRCHQLFWDSCQNCDRCYSINQHVDSFFEEDTVMKDGKTRVHIKAKVDNWNGRWVKVHYLTLI